MAQIMKIPGARGMLMVAAVFAVLLGLLCVGQATGLSFAIVHLWNGDALGDQIGWIVLFGVCFVLRSVINTIERARIDTFAAQSADQIRQSLLDAAWQCGPAFVRAHGTGALVADATEGVDSIEELIRILIPKMANVVIIPLVLLVAMFSLDWVSGIIALVCYPFIIVFMRLIGMSAGSEARKRYAEFERMSSSFADITSGISTLKAFGAADRFADKVFSASERFRELTMKTLRIAMLSTTVLDLFATLCLAAVAIMLGFRLVDETMQLFPALCILMLVPEFFKPVREYGEDYHATLEGEAALVSALAAIRQAEAMKSTADYGAATLHSLDITPGEATIVGLIGPSGSGKTTLLDRIAGFGTARNDSWASRIAYIPQSPTIFHATLRENVAFYAPHVPDDRIHQALDHVGLADLADRLPEGLDTTLGESGRALSGGQAQRVAVARALLDDRRDIWLLDEPTAHLDAQTEVDLIACMLPLMQHKTVVMAIHGTAWLPHVDRIIEMTPAQKCEAT